MVLYTFSNEATVNKNNKLAEYEMLGSVVTTVGTLAIALSASILA
jgi:hypothetical protein